MASRRCSWLVRFYASCFFFLQVVEGESTSGGDGGLREAESRPPLVVDLRSSSGEEVGVSKYAERGSTVEADWGRDLGQEGATPVVHTTVMVIRDSNAYSLGTDGVPLLQGVCRVVESLHGYPRCSLLVEC
ncbi:hypothetical protein VNO78_07838 [Psophocarpus tetragonolobus]|uniref:Uncharacterized protein n=1 Tax=Psophocarpus tetragonolobus TaxID=3891 RepID=A0AAN9T3Y5_PSOTE